MVIPTKYPMTFTYLFCAQVFPLLFCGEQKHTTTNMVPTPTASLTARDARSTQTNGHNHDRTVPVGGVSRLLPTPATKPQTTRRRHPYQLMTVTQYVAGPQVIAQATDDTKHSIIHPGWPAATSPCSTTATCLTVGPTTMETVTVPLNPHVPYSIANWWKEPRGGRSILDGQRGPLYRIYPSCSTRWTAGHMQGGTSGITCIRGGWADDARTSF